MNDPTRPDAMPHTTSLRELAERYHEHVLPLIEHRCEIVVLTDAQRGTHAIGALVYSHALSERALHPRWSIAVDALSAGATAEAVGAAMGGLEPDELRAGLRRWADGQHREGLITEQRRRQVRALVSEPDRNTQHSKEPQMARNIPLPDGSRLDLDKEIELSDGSRIRLGDATKDQLDDHLVLLRRWQTDQLIEAGLHERIADMMVRSGAVITADLNDSAARDDLDRTVLRILTEIISEPVTDSLMIVPRLTPEQYESCARAVEGNPR